MKRKVDTEILREVASRATQVVSWYPHSGGGAYGPEATVRGPYMRWFRVADIDGPDRKHVASARDDANFAAAAMNNLIPLIDELEEARKRIDELEGILKLESIIMGDEDAS